MLVRILTFYLSKWWLPLLCLWLSAGVILLSALTNSNVLGWSGNILLVVGVISALVSTIYQAVLRRWLGVILSCAGVALWVAFMVPFSLALSFMMPVDDYADDLEIPGNISISDPVDTYDNSRGLDSIVNMKVTGTKLVLYNASQPGIYEFDVWLPKVNSGTVYLKAYEVTKNDPLSDDRLGQASSIDVVNQSDTFKRFHSNGTFTIYEGDWGKPYAARFEVWYNPADGTAERKLYQQVYRIEGWER